MPGFQFYFELIGAVAFAISGAALAVKKHMDLFGVAMMGMTTAVGGGILRDLLLGITPPAALRDPLQALVAIATSLLVFLVWKRFHPEGDHRNWEALLLVADSIGLGIFSVHGGGGSHPCRPGRQCVPDAAGGYAYRRGRRCSARPVLYGAPLHFHQAYLRLRIPGRRGGMYAAVERRREPGAADRLRADGGAAALCRGIPLEPAESVNT